MAVRAGIHGITKDTVVTADRLRDDLICLRIDSVVTIHSDEVGDDALEAFALLGLKIHAAIVGTMTPDTPAIVIGSKELLDGKLD